MKDGDFKWPLNLRSAVPTRLEKPELDIPFEPLSLDFRRGVFVVCGDELLLHQLETPAHCQDSAKGADFSSSPHRLELNVPTALIELVRNRHHDSTDRRPYSFYLQTRMNMLRQPSPMGRGGR